MESTSNDFRETSNDRQPTGATSRYTSAGHPCSPMLLEPTPTPRHHEAELRDTSLIFLPLYYWQIIIENQWRCKRVSPGVKIGSELDIVTTTTQQTVATSAPMSRRTKRSLKLYSSSHALYSPRDNLVRRDSACIALSGYLASAHPAMRIGACSFYQCSIHRPHEEFISFHPDSCLLHSQLSFDPCTSAFAAQVTVREVLMTSC